MRPRRLLGGQARRRAPNRAVLMLRVIEPGDRNQQWLGVADIMKAEAHEAANAALDKFAKRAHRPRRHRAGARHPRGRSAEEMVKLIEEDEDIASWCSPPAPARKARARSLPCREERRHLPDPGRDRARAI